MPDKNVQLPDGRVVAFPDSMADADISAIIKKQLNAPTKSQQDQTHTLLNMTAAMSGQKMQTPADQAQFEEGKKAGAVSAAETVGGTLGAESVPAIRGIVGSLVKMLGTGGGAAAGNAAGQFATSGTVDPTEAAKAGALWSGGAGIGEVFGAGLPALRSSLSRAMYTTEGELTPLAKAVVHPTELPETLLRKAIPETPDPATGLTSTDRAALEQKGTDLMKRQAQQDILDRKAAAAAKVAAKNAPTPPTFGQNATSSSFADLKVPAAPKIETDGLGIRWAVSEDGLRVSIPKSVADADATAYAGPKLQEQRDILGGIKNRTQLAGDIPQGSPQLFATGGGFTAPQPSKIQTALSPPPPINRTLVSYDRNLLVHMARGGDLNALRELIRNPGDIDVASAVPNSKYLLEPGAPTSIYGGPGSTKP